MAALFARDVDPVVGRRMSALESQALAAVVRNPFRMPYARIAIDIEYRGSKYHGSPLTESLDRASVHSVSMTFRTRNEDVQTISERDFFTPTTTVPFRRVDRVTSYEPLATQDVAHRVAYAAQQMVAHGTPVASAFTGLSTAQKLQLARAYGVAAANNPTLQSQAASVVQGLEAELAAETRYGVATVRSVRANLADGRTARAAAARTHWGSPEERLRWVEAYVALSQAPEHAALNASARTYLSELQTEAERNPSFTVPTF